MPKLSNAEKSAAAAVERLTKGSSSGSSSRARTPAATSSPSTSTATPNRAIPIGGNREVSVAVPGLFAMNEGSIAAMLPVFDPNSFSVTDPLNPPDTMPQATVEQFDRGMSLYEGGVRALQLYGASYDLSREKFSVLGKQAKAVTAGFNALTSQEQTKGAMLDYHTQLEVTQQKGLKYQLATHQTATETAAFPHAVIQLDEALKQQEIKGQLAQAKTAQALGNLTEFQRSIGKYLPSPSA